MEEEVRVRVEAEIARRFPHLEVHVRQARLASDGIEVRGVSLVEPGVTGPQPELAYLDEVFLACRTDVQELASGQPRITAVTLTRPVIRATRRPDGRFSLEKLVADTDPNEPVPRTVINGGVFEIFDPLKNPSSTLTLRDIHVTLQPAHDQRTGANQIELEGYVTGDHVRKVEVIGTIDLGTTKWTASGTVDGLQISPELRTALPEPLARAMAPLAQVRAPADLSFRASGQPGEATPQFEVNGTVAGGRIEHPRLPHALTNLKARIHADNSGFRIWELTAEHGQTTWAVAEFVQRGYATGSPYELKTVGRNVTLDQGWRDAMPEAWQANWGKYDPKGVIDVDCNLSFDGHKWQPQLKLTSRRGNDVSFSFYKFPYRMERAEGTVTLHGNVLDVNLVAYSGAQPVTLKGQFLNPGPQFSGSIDIHGERIQFDDKLFAAILKPKQRNAIRSLNPVGTFDIDAKLWRTPDDPLPRPNIHKHLAVSVNHCSVKYDKLPYPLGNLHGRLEMDDGRWRTIGQLEGTNDTGVVHVRGTLNTSPEMDVLTLNLDAKNVQLEEELRDALPETQRRLWKALRPRGNIDIWADVTYNSRVRKPSIELRLVPHADWPEQASPGSPALDSLHADEVASSGMSIEPVAFPYQMSKLSGMVYYHNGHAELQDVRAQHRGTRMRARGSCILQPDGGWRLNLERFSVDRIHLGAEDHELEAALPAALRRAVAELNPKGPINMTGALQFAKAGPAAPLQAGWDVDLFLHQNRLHVGPRLDNVFGAIRLTGSSLGPKYTSFGQLKLDSLTYKNFQFTEILGPLWFNNEHVYLGTLPVAPLGGQKSGRITARLYGGVVGADGHVRLGKVPQYRLVATLSAADLGQFAAENLTNHQKLNGKILANIDLQGSRGQHTLVGRGDVHLTDADVYELPLVVSLLSIVRAKVPGPTAFSESDIAFQINGQHVVLNRIDLRGDALDLSGYGEMTLDGQSNPIKLELHTAVGRGRLPVISGLFSEASQQILKIHVAGTLDHPTTSTEALPFAAQALERLRPDYGQPTGTPQAGGNLWSPGARR